jgi:arabinose-5-phosphate isomerase
VKTAYEIKQIALDAISMEVNAVIKQKDHIDDNFSRAILKIVESKGRVVVTGIGKSAIIGSKIVASFNSTGTPSAFMHAADAIHGDLGIIQENDVVICISNSGNTPEIKVLIPMLKSLGACLIAMVGNPNSHLAKQADIVINVAVDQEAIPGNPAPTASTTAQLVMGDAMAVALLQCRGFSLDDFARYHPGGSLGKQLYLKAKDIYPNNASPKVDINDDIEQVIIEISGKRLGATAVIDNDKLAGIVTDGDLRRMMQKNHSINGLTAKDIMSVNPKTINPDTMAVEALQIMRENNITQLLVVDNNIYVGVVHLHDILKEGVI